MNNHFDGNFDAPTRPQPVQAYRETFVQPYHPHELTRDESELLGVSTRMAGEIMSRRQMNALVRSDDSAVTHATGSLIYSLAFIPIMALVTGAMMLFACWALDGDGWLFFMLWLFVWGLSCLGALLLNRRLGLRYSAGGIAHAEIESRERVALYVVDRHIEMLERKMGLRQ